MNLLLSIVIHTANILGSFNDPFEFEGDYGPEVNPVRQKVFELVVSKEALTQNLTDSQVKNLMQDADADEPKIRSYKKLLLTQAIEEDRQHGPILSELVTQELITELINKQKQLKDVGFTDTDLKNILHFIDHYGDQKVFRFLRNNPSELLSLDKILRDKASHEGKSLDLPILSSTHPLRGQTAHELKLNLLHALFTEETFRAVKSEETLKKSLESLDEDFLQEFFGENAANQDLQVFCTPAGQTFFYWLYQALNLHLISEENVVDEINKVKDIFARTLGNPKARAQAFKEKLITANSGVLFTQESDAFVPQTLLENGFFLPIDKQNPKDGTFIFLRSDLWEPDYESVIINDYEGSIKGRLNVILATHIETGERFLLASGHGNSTHPEDGRLQISLIMDKFHQLSQNEEGLQLIIGIDANTKTDEDVKALREHLDSLGLMATNMGPTTIKKRMVTAQHSKAGRAAIDEEDYLIVLKPEKGGRFQLDHQTIGFKEEKADINTALPNLDNPSDHYPVGANLEVL